jgi:phospholipid-transporting ATPase
MMERMHPYNNNRDMIKKAKDSLTEFSNVGLRTLVVAYRTLTGEEYQNFKKVYDEAECSITDREEQIAEASDLVEKELELLGCTAIEDRLQDQVPETIENLLSAGIKLWLLTGDSLLVLMYCLHRSRP